VGKGGQREPGEGHCQSSSIPGPYSTFSSFPHTHPDPFLIPLPSHLLTTFILPNPLPRSTLTIIVLPPSTFDSRCVQYFVTHLIHKVVRRLFCPFHFFTLTLQLILQPHIEWVHISASALPTACAVGAPGRSSHYLFFSPMFPYSTLFCPILSRFAFSFSRSLA